jgi:ribonuclease Z
MENVTIHSLGLYSSFCYHKPTRTLFDCGEGASMAFGNHIYGVERMLITHGHGDHVLGLPSFIGIRNSARGDKEKPLSVYYPSDNFGVRDVVDFVEKRNRKWLSYELNWFAQTEEFSIELGNNKRIKSFKSKHQKFSTTFLYKIEESRTRLKAEFNGEDVPALLRSGKVDKKDLTDSYTHVEFAYLLDSCGFDVNEIKGATEVVIDCTFLKEEDRDDPTHFYLDEVLNICEVANVKKVTLAHISPRYSYNDVKEIKKKIPSNYSIHHPKYKI